jgi:tRNA threonylcarbamoyladenosine biosynthesis protein TsaE
VPDAAVTTRVTTRGPAGTRRLGEALGRRLVGGESIALVGELGAGKTAFVQGAARGLEVPAHVYVNSPTFTIVNRYVGRVEVFHVDLYRIDHADELVQVGFADLPPPGAVLFVEWCDKFPEMAPRPRLEVSFARRGAWVRAVTLRVVGEDAGRYAPLIARLGTGG